MSNDKQTQKTSTKPTHSLCKKVQTGKKSEFETIGVAWERDGGGFYCKVYGTQIIEGGFYAFPNKDDANEEGGQ